MGYTSLYKLFFSDSGKYKKIYEERFEGEYTVHLDFTVNNCPAFFVAGPELYGKIVKIYKTDKHLSELRYALPEKAIDHFAHRCLVDEIILSNDIEGVNSSRREINSVLSESKTRSRGKRFKGLVQKYLLLQSDDTLSFRTCEDIRELYNDLVYPEIAEDDRDNLPDGAIFRKGSTSVLSATQKELHVGAYPESKIIECMNKALDILNDDSMEFLFRIAVFHYLFGYIHPFYDGNGRTSRFISSYLLSKEFESIIGYRLSFSIKENIKKYYDAFKICNDTRNRGDLTPFVIMFTDIICEAFEQLEEALTRRCAALEHYSSRIDGLPCGTSDKFNRIYYLLIQASLFSESGIGIQELLEILSVSRTTLSARLKVISDNGLLIRKTVDGSHRYSLDLAAADKMFSEKAE